MPAPAALETADITKQREGLVTSALVDFVRDATATLTRELAGVRGRLDEMESKAVATELGVNELQSGFVLLMGRLRDELEQEAVHRNMDNAAIVAQLERMNAQFAFVDPYAASNDAGHEYQEDFSQHHLATEPDLHQLDALRIALRGVQDGPSSNVRSAAGTSGLVSAEHSVGVQSSVASGNTTARPAIETCPPFGERFESFVSSVSSRLEEVEQNLRTLLESPVACARAAPANSSAEDVRVPAVPEAERVRCLEQMFHDEMLREALSFESRFADLREALGDVTHESFRDLESRLHDEVRSCRDLIVQNSSRKCAE